MWRWITVCVCSLVVSLFAIDAVYAQGSVPDAAAAVAINIAIPDQAVAGREPIKFSISVRNTHPRETVTFSALIIVEEGVAGPESWSADVTRLADSYQGRIYRWNGTVAPRKTVALEAISATGGNRGVFPALTVRLVSDQDELISTREIELVQATGQPRGRMELTDISGDDCELGEDCVLIVSVRSPDLQSFSGGPFATQGCEFLGLDEEFSVDADHITEQLFWFVTRTEGPFGSGCTISTPVVMGTRNFSVIYKEASLLYLPALQQEVAASQ